jgi:hypothetical protein
MERDWRPTALPISWSAKARRWCGRFVILGAAVLSSLSIFASLRHAPWWSLSGLPVNPGNFVAKLPVDYPFCADWMTTQDGTPRDQRIVDLQAHSQRVKALSTTTVVRGGGQANLGLVLPEAARILKVYCATSRSNDMVVECSAARCVPPMSVLISDNEYTRGRALEVTFVNKAPSGTNPVRGRLWIIWTEGSDGRPVKAN